MASHTAFSCDACGKRGFGVPGQYLYPDPPLGWRWAFGAMLEGPHACTRRCWDTLGTTPDGKVRLWDSHEARVEHSAPCTATTERSPASVKPVRMVRSWVYFARSGTDGPIKIGWSKNPTARLKELSVASPAGLSLVLAVPGDARDERRLHAQFAAHRLHGEWFNPAPELLSHIASLHGVKS